MENIQQDPFSYHLQDTASPIGNRRLFPSYPDSCPPSPRYDPSSEPNAVEEFDFSEPRPTNKTFSSFCLGNELPTTVHSLLDPEPLKKKKAPQEGNSSALANGKKERKKRGKYRKKKRAAEDSEEREMVRLERNRKSAKESRQKKKKYIQQLEHEVDSLKSELHHCKQKLTMYEKIEQYRSVTNLPAYKLIKEKQSQSIFEVIEENYPELTLAGFLTRCNLEAEERKQVIDHLVKTTVEVIMPATHKYLLWAAENNSGFFNTDCIDEFNLMPKVRDEWDEIVKDVDLTDEEVKAINDVKPFLAQSAVIFRKLINQFVESKRKILVYVNQMDEQIKLLVTRIGQPVLCAFIKWFDKMKDKPELSDEMFYGINNGTEVSEEVVSDYPFTVPAPKRPNIF